MAKFLKTLALLFLVVILAAVVGCAAPVTAQGGAPAATNIQVVNGHNPGEVIITWDAPPEATFYRIGYVNMVTDYPIAKASRTGDWRGAFVYVDTEAQNFDRKVYTIRRLDEGVRHAFTVLTNNARFGQPTWPDEPYWQFLTVTDQGGACPTAAPVAEPLSNAELARRVKPALAHLIVTPSDGNTYEGSGFVVRSDGLVVTNRHVVDDAGTVTARMSTSDGRNLELTGRVLGRGILSDLAVIQLPAGRTYATLPLGNSSAVTFGDAVTAWGYPLGSALGNEPSVSRGIISSLNRTFDDTNYFQTDATLNPGNSGGPMVDAYGRVVGVNTGGLAIIAEDGTRIPVPGIYLAIASNEVSNRLNTLVSGGPLQATYRNLRFGYGYSMNIPRGWYIARELPIYSTFLPYTGRRTGTYIMRYQKIAPYQDRSAELSLLANYYWDTALPDYAAKNWSYFQKVSKIKVNVGGLEFYRLEYGARWEPGLCILNYVELVGVSSSFPNKPYGFVTGSGICEDSLGTYSTERQTMLNSFRP